MAAIEVDALFVNCSQGQLRFDSQIEIESTGLLPFSSGGDSGSLIVDQHFAACGLLFAASPHGGSNNQGLTYANDISIVPNSLEVDMLT